MLRGKTFIQIINRELITLHFYFGWIGCYMCDELHYGEYVWSLILMIIL